MQPGIRIIKHGRDEQKDCAPTEIVKTDRERERETADKVKGWITEWEARNRTLKNAALLLVHSLQESRRSSAVLSS